MVTNNEPLLPWLDGYDSDESSWTSLGMSTQSCVIKSAGTVCFNFNIQLSAADSAMSGALRPHVE